MTHGLDPWSQPTPAPACMNSIYDTYPYIFLTSFMHVPQGFFLDILNNQNAKSIKNLKALQSQGKQTIQIYV